MQIFQKILSEESEFLKNFFYSLNYKCCKIDIF